MLVEEIKLMLGDAAANYSDALINLCLKQALLEVEEYCGRSLDASLELAAEKIAIIKLNRMNTEGLNSQSYSGVSENYIDGYPADILAILNKKRKIKVMQEVIVMINNQMKNYNYYAYSNDNAYGQPSLSETAQGKIKMAINVTSQFVQDNILLYNVDSYVSKSHYMEIVKTNENADIRGCLL